MGFMEGFANAFGRQIEAGQERRATAKRDAFQMAYDKYLKDRAAYDTAKAEDTALINSAKSITSSIPNVPEGAWEHAYTWLRSGYTPLQVEAKLKETIFAVQETPESPEQAPTPQTVAPVPDPQQTQMVESGMLPGQEQTTGQQNPDLMGSIFGADGILNPQANYERRMEGARNQVMKGVGIDQAEFDQVSSGYTPYTPTGNAPQIEGIREEQKPAFENFNDEFVWVRTTEGLKEGIPDGQGGYTDINGEKIENVTGAMTQDGTRRYDDALNHASEVTRPLAEQKAAVQSLADRGVDMVELVENNEYVLTTSSNVSTFLNTIGNELNAIMGQSQELFGSDIQAAEERLIASATANITGTDEISNAKRQFESMRIQFVFSLARSMNGPGPLTQGDIEQAARVIGTSDPQEFTAIVQNLIQVEGSKYNRQAEEAFKMDPKLQNAISLGVPGVEELFGPIEWGDNADFMERVMEQPSTTPNGQAPRQTPNQIDTGITDQDIKVTIKETNIQTLEGQGIPREILEQYKDKNVIFRRNPDGTYSLLDEQGTVIFE